MYATADELIVSIMTLRKAPIAERIHAVAAAGCSGLGWRLDDFAAPKAEQEIPALLRKAGVHAAEIEFFRNWLGQEKSAAYRADETRLFEISRRLGARHINVAVFTRHSLEEVTAGFKGLCRRAAPYGLLVQLEFMPYTPPVDSLHNAWEVVRGADEPNGGLLIDAWHWGRTPGSSAALKDIPPERITSVQLGDVLPEPMADITEESRHYRCIPGSGSMDVPGFLQTLKKHGVTAPLSVEVMSDALDALPPIRAAQTVANGVRTVLRSFNAMDYPLKESSKRG